MVLSTVTSLAYAVFLVIFGTPVAAAENFEPVREFNASDILPANDLSGPNHKVEKKVYDDGYLYHYTINSPFGTVKAVSTATLFKRIKELNAVGLMARVKDLDEFKSGVEEKGEDVLKGTKNLVIHPVDTVSDAVSGVGKLFHRAGENLAGDSRSDAESSRTEQLIGFAKTKRDIAYEYKVDVYSRNKVMQKHLDEIAWAGYAGNISMSALIIAVPGAAGAVLSATADTQLMDKVFRDKAPADLHSMNREKLKGMGVHADIIDLYISNSVFTPREQTLLVAALDEMKNTSGREVFVKFAISTDNAEVAEFRKRQAVMYAQYNRKVAPVNRFVSVGGVVVGQLVDGNLIMIVPMDNLLWTKSMARFFRTANEKLKALPGATGKQLWLSGTISPLARKEIEALGWKVVEQGGGKLTVVQ